MERQPSARCRNVMQRCTDCRLSPRTDIVAHVTAIVALAGASDVHKRGRRRSAGHPVCACADRIRNRMPGSETGELHYSNLQSHRSSLWYHHFIRPRLTSKIFSRGSSFFTFKIMCASSKLMFSSLVSAFLLLPDPMGRASGAPSGLCRASRMSVRALEEGRLVAE